MTPHQLGLELRQLVLGLRSEGCGLDPRRLQAAIGDLCGSEHSDLAPPLRYLVLSAAFASAAGQDSPLGDPRQLGRLQQELAEVYAAPLCQRLQPLLEGLLGLAATEPAVSFELPPSVAPWASGAASPAAAGSSAATPSGATRPGAAVPLPSAPHPMGMAPQRQAGASPPNTALAFVSGMLLMALAGLGLWMQQRPPQPQASRNAPAAGAAGRPSAAAPPAAPAPPATIPEPEDTAAAGEAAEQAAPASGSGSIGSGSSGEAGALDRSRDSVNALYDALSAKDYARARRLFGAAAADQFDPAFFDQFAQVTVQDLRLISQNDSSVTLEGVVNFVYPDGTTQAETRTFALDSGSEPPLIVASAFGRVIKPR